MPPAHRAQAPRAGVHSAALVGLLAAWDDEAQAHPVGARPGPALPPGPVAPQTPPTPPAPLAQRLGQWLGWTDAIALSAALQLPTAAADAAAGAGGVAPAAGGTAGGAAGVAAGGTAADPARGVARAASPAAAHSQAPDPAAAAATASAAARAAAADLQQLRLQLLQAIADVHPLRPVPAAPRRGPAGRPGAGTPGAASPAEDWADPATHRRHVQALQRLMGERIGALRGRWQALLARQSPEGARLAALDAALAQALAVREEHLLASVLPRLALRLDHWRRACPPATGPDPDPSPGPGPAAQSASPAPPAAPAAHPAHPAHPPGAPQASRSATAARVAEPPAWLAGFADDLQRVLQAELALRLQPLHGLLAALRQPAGRPPAGPAPRPADRPTDRLADGAVARPVGGPAA